MTREQVASEFGDSISESTNSRNEIEESRDGLVIRYDETGIVEFAFTPDSAEPVFRGISLFHQEDPISELLQFDPNPVECFGFILFLRVGITVTGYHDNTPSQRAITCFRRGRWDSMSNHFTHYA
ncbi:hypothetical protein Caka_0872 [Coraliomargarita akajimensis DSM 45221]|uniref:Uncharacterized protein n=1 Tax=Coraliomargarita akajimensis (strain DSM 45221 / IAM 15411 / JCM 23193 / KCTC 12865 / 04OKA010-24) TaxID=583355 RepID=D5EQC7_CORAD|nr:hypothetical protein Caka_0872 [Coraliomargarita akajimensis DSM 45221]